MTMLARFLMICALGLTSLGLGVARGTVPAADQMVLCAGGTTTTVELDAAGRPVLSTHLCPDMAPGFLAGWDAPPPMPQRPDGRAEAAAPPKPEPRPMQVRVLARARGPPVRARA